MEHSFDYRQAEVAERKARKLRAQWLASFFKRG